MKHALLAALVSGSVFISACASALPPQAAGNGVSQAAQTAAADPAGQSANPSDPPATAKTRAEVYQELVRAERDGQLANLNSTIYAHP
ncbi:hypothetical protein [Trinickia mobilis]|uniref:hypothetical protein n=1 Tax=Trinickia mobilis TaxID=2816356 RepID=UPI002867D7D1|nr:hypothetical protein [Trinickia mobilis]